MLTRQLFGNLSLHTFDVVIHRRQFHIGSAHARRDFLDAGLVLDRPGERMESTALDVGDDLLGFAFDLAPGR